MTLRTTERTTRQKRNRQWSHTQKRDDSRARWCVRLLLVCTSSPSEALQRLHARARGKETAASRVGRTLDGGGLTLFHSNSPVAETNRYQHRVPKALSDLSLEPRDDAGRPDAA